MGVLFITVPIRTLRVFLKFCVRSNQFGLLSGKKNSTFTFACMMKKHHILSIALVILFRQFLYSVVEIPTFEVHRFGSKCKHEIKLVARS